MRLKRTFILISLIWFCFSGQAAMDAAGRYPDVIFRVDTDKKFVALTFDDGPHPVYTPMLLEVLSQEGAPATFFLLGKQVEKHPRIAARIHFEGHELGNHGYSHRVMRFLSWKEIFREIKKTEKLIAYHVGVKTTLFRPPFGEMVPVILDVNRYAGYKFIRWSIDPKDWDQSRNAATIATHALTVVKPGDVILFHDGGANQKETIEAVRQIVRDLKKRGYRFVTVSQLLKYANK